MISSEYRGRFAPSPTGELHLGSLYIAVASFLDAGQHQIRHHKIHARSQSKLLINSSIHPWFIRIDDLDEQRCKTSYTESILDDLKAFLPLEQIQHKSLLHQSSSDYDQLVVFQSQRKIRYETAIQQLNEKGLLFYCTCSRKSLKSVSSIHEKHNFGRCYQRQVPPEEKHSICLLPQTQEHPPKDNSVQLFPELVLKRSDGFYAYHLACAVDDALDGITRVVRGADLLEETLPQVRILNLLEYTPPEYYHLPLLVDEKGRKLSK